MPKGTDVFEFTAEKVFISDQEKVDFFKNGTIRENKIQSEEMQDKPIIESVSKDMMDDKSCY